MTCYIAPCTVKAATKKVREWHRHLPDIQGGLFAAQCVDPQGNCVGVAIAGNPSRVWQGQSKLVIQRVATQGYDNACSALYGALCRAAKALGYVEVWTYTLPHEPGTSLRAAGFMDKGLTDGGEWSRPSRTRKPALRPEPKRRWQRILAETCKKCGRGGNHFVSAGSTTPEFYTCRVVTGAFSTADGADK